MSVNPLSSLAASLPQASGTPQPGSAAALPMTGLVSPYDGTTPMTGQPIANPGMGGYGVPQLTGPGAGGTSPQVNATNQTALAPNGDVNQSVTNSNQYTNKYYNIIVPNGGLGGYGNLMGGSPGNSFIDPQTGVLYVQQDTGVLGWFKRLFRGY